MDAVPVVIVGGGPVGMTAALLLANYDIPSVVLEASPERDPIGSKALCMQRDVLDILERVGCGDRLLDEGVTWTLGRTYFRNHELFQITFPEVGDNHYPPFVNVGQDRTEFWLEQAIDSEPLVELRYGHRAVALRQDGAHVVVAAESSGGQTEIIADYVIGADGARSAIRGLIGAEFPGKSFEDKFLICDIRADLGFANERRFFFDPEWNPDRQVLIHPQADSVWRIDWQVPPDFDLEAEQSSGGLEARIRMIVGDDDYEVVWMSVYRFHQRISSKFREGRVFLAGDAAHIVSPFGARGLNSGVQDAENLAWKLAYVHNSWGDHGLLDTYGAERRAAALENLRVTGDTMDFLVPPTPELWETRRETLEQAVDNPQARQMVDSGKLATPYTYTASALTTPGPALGVIEPGSLFPDAAIAVSSRPEIQRMRQLFGGSVINLLTGSAKPRADGDGYGDSPVIVHQLSDIDTEGTLHSALGLSADSVGEGHAIVLRPDGHVAAIVPADEAPQASRRAVGRF